MKTAAWEASPGALASLLDSGAPLTKVDLYTLTLPSGVVYRWSGSDTPITAGPTLYLLGPGLKRTRVRFAVGVEVDSLTLTITDNAATLINGRPLIAFIRAGGFNGARLRLDRGFWGLGSTAPIGTLEWFSGAVAEISRLDRYEAQISVKSDLERLDAKVPRDLYQAGCLNTLFDTACGASRASATTTGATTTASDPARVTVGHAMPQPAGHFELGVLTLTNGANAGQSRTVKLHTATSITTLAPWPFPVAAGATFTVAAGCDKSLSGPNGCPKFHGLGAAKQRFRGQPFIPVPETVL